MFPTTSLPELANQLTADAYWHLAHTLCLALPAPPSGHADDLARRDRAAIARVAALVPGNAAEAELAAQFVAASEQSKHCLRLAEAPQTGPEWAAKCRAQAIAMMRQANGALRLLQRMQDRRRKIEADGAAADRLAWAEHCALGLMAEALRHCPAPAPAETGPLPQADAAPAALDTPANEAAATARAGEPDLIRAAERYAAAYPERAAAIRRTGKLPCDVRYFDPPEAALARALIAGSSPALAALDALPLSVA